MRQQQELGIDVPSDGEFGKSVGHRVNYGAWWNYAFLRLGGLELGGPSLDHMTPRPARPGEIVLTTPLDGATGCGSPPPMATPSSASPWGRGPRPGRSASGR